jgi:CelD/BcsL family acetyltransferase involved in cellulose biosynthesis
VGSGQGDLLPGVPPDRRPTAEPGTVHSGIADGRVGAAGAHADQQLTSRPGPGRRLVAEVRAGAGALPGCAGFDRLAQRLGLPLTARLDYLGRFAVAHREWEPWVVAVTGADGEWQAGALLARRTQHGLTRVAGLGHQVCDHGRLPAADPAAAVTLADAITSSLAALRGPWTLRLEQLPAGDPVARLLANRLRHADIVPGVGLPRIDLSAGRAPETYLPKKYRQQVRAAGRRFAAAGVQPRTVYLRTPAEIEPLLDDLLAIRRSRDRAALYGTELSDERRVAWWRATMLRLAERGQLELAVLDVGAGPPAGYSTALLDGTSYRLWDGRINPDWHDQWPGQLLLGELLPRVIADPRWAEIDYMRGETPFKLRTANDVVPTSHLLAWSSVPVRLAVQAPPLARRELRAWRAAHPPAERAWRAVRGRLRRP